MCLVIFKCRPARGIRRFILFNRDEDIHRKRSHFGIHFAPHRIVCGVDLQAEGTWLGVNLDTGNFGFLTNYENKPFQYIDDTTYRRGNLLMNFLKAPYKFMDSNHYQDYLNLFLEEGQKFNGTNIWLANLHFHEQVIFAHNQSLTNNFHVLYEDQIYAFGNGDMNIERQKQKLAKKLAQQAFLAFENEGTNDISLLKDLLFKAAECSHAEISRENWSQIELYNDQEKFDHSSIFLEKHILHGGTDFESEYATVSSTVLLQSDDNHLFIFERLYNHNELRDYTDEEKRLEQLLLDNGETGYLNNDDFSKINYKESVLIHKLE